MSRAPFLAGVVEGFYGRPWTPAQRHALVRRLGALGLNTYLYAPKDDLRHRARWREAYPAGEAAALRDLIAACGAAGVEFVYALAPGLDPAYAQPE
jgi:protein O-GlcNAcase/histone acetyltransferase